MLVVLRYSMRVGMSSIFFFQAEDGIRDLVRSRGLGDVYKRQGLNRQTIIVRQEEKNPNPQKIVVWRCCLFEG